MKLRMIRTEKRWRREAERKADANRRLQLELGHALHELVEVSQQLRAEQAKNAPRPQPRTIKVEYTDGYVEQLNFYGHPNRG